MKALKLILTGILFLASTAFAGDIAVRGERIYTVTGDMIENGAVVIRDGKIAAVGSADDVAIPQGMRVVNARVVTPGLIDAHTVIGLAGRLNQSQDQDQLESSEAIQPELRAIDAYNPREELIAWVRDFGVTTIHTGHGPGEIVSGQTMIAKTTGNTVAEAAVVSAKMLAVTLGEGAFPDNDGGRKSPGTRGKVAAMLRNELIAARAYAEKLRAADADDDKDAPDRNLRLESLASVLDSSMQLLVTVQRHQDILTALRLADEFDIDIVLDGAAESYLVIDEIKAAGVPVILHPAMQRAGRERENLSFTTAANLIEAGIPVAFQSGFEGYVPKTRVVLFEAAITLQHGVSFEQALATLTIDAAEILGIDEQVGSIEVGKDGDLALYDGDPFEYTTHSTMTIIEGVVVSDTVR